MLVAVAVAVAVAVGVSVMVPVGVWVTVGVAVIVGVRVAVRVMVGLCVIVAVCVRVLVPVAVAVAVRVGTGTLPTTTTSFLHFALVPGIASCGPVHGVGSMFCCQLIRVAISSCPSLLSSRQTTCTFEISSKFTTGFSRSPHASPSASL